MAKPNEDDGANRSQRSADRRALEGRGVPISLPSNFKAQANLRDPRIFDRSGWTSSPIVSAEYADIAHVVRAISHRPRYQRRAVLEKVAGGKIKRVAQLVDRHLANTETKAAFIFVPEPEAERDVVITLFRSYMTASMN